MDRRYEKASLGDIAPSECPCGRSRRAFMESAGRPATVHLLEVKRDTAAHYHKTLTELYTVLEGEGFIELDGEMVPVKPMDTVMIRPLCRHRPVGQMTLLNVVTPGFDPEDEWMV